MATKPLSDLTATWNSAGTTFSAIKMNVTDTASAAGSLLLNLQLNGMDRFKIEKTGAFVAAQGSFTVTTLFNTVLWNDATFGWSSASGVTTATTADTVLRRDAADTLAQRRGTNAQMHRWYRSFTDASNYSRVYLGWSSSTAILATEGAGTGARGNIAFGTAALATSATVGYVMIPSSNGAPTGVPADIPTGQVALHYDTANNKIYVYNGGWVSTAALT